MEQGYIHVYTGNGKGKTTAAFGLTVRALCAGKSVYIGQFVKSMKYNETGLENFFDRLKIEQLGRGCYLQRNPEPQDIEMAQQGLKRCWTAMYDEKYDVVVLDELTIAIHFGLLEVAEVVDWLKNKRTETEVVITGRYASPELIEVADLVTDMKEVKHYYMQGVLSRNGIDR